MPCCSVHWCHSLKHEDQVAIDNLSSSVTLMIRKEIFLKNKTKQNQNWEPNPGTCTCWASTLPLCQIPTSKISFKVKISSLFCLHVYGFSHTVVWMWSEDTVWKLILLSTTGSLELEQGPLVWQQTPLSTVHHTGPVSDVCQSDGELSSTKVKCLDVYFQLYTSGGGWPWFYFS